MDMENMLLCQRMKEDEFSLFVYKHDENLFTKIFFACGTIQNMALHIIPHHILHTCTSFLFVYRFFYTRHVFRGEVVLQASEITFFGK
jgi:hypothetical protein